MRGYGYDRDEVVDYDEYEEEGEEQEEEGEEEECEGEEERKPSAEELEYLELRQRLKEQIRKKMKKESGSTLSKSQERNKKLPFDNYGSFFGPSQPVIAQRVIQESKSLLENPHLALKVANSHNSNKKNSSSTATVLKNGVHKQVPKVKNELKTKAEKLKNTRDYSFLLSDEAELPAPTKETASRNVFSPSTEARSGQLPQKTKPSLGNSARNAHVAQEVKKSVSMNGQLHSKARSYNSTSANKTNSMSMDVRRQPGSNNGTGLGQPGGSKALPVKTSVATMEKKAPAPGAKSILPAGHRPPISKMQSSKQQLEQKNRLQEHKSRLQQQLEQKNRLQEHKSRLQEQRDRLKEPNKSKLMPKQPVAASKPQMGKPPAKKISSSASLPERHPKKRPNYLDDDTDEAFRWLRSMLGPKRYAGYSDDDDSDMEANFEDIMREERRSAKIAKQEDEEQRRLIEEEERQERMRKLAKKRKLMG